MNLIIPENYKSKLDKPETVKAVQKIIDYFGNNISKKLHLQRVIAPLIYRVNSGLSENYNGTFPAISFQLNGFKNEYFEIIRSVTKWKRQFLSDLKIDIGKGIISDVMGARPDEVLSNIHSVQVDQWDWELIISQEQYHINFLKKIVEKIYSVLFETEKFVSDTYNEIKPILPDKITFLHSEQLIKEFPKLTQSERKNIVAKKYGAIFILGIGRKLSNDDIYERASDGDDWISSSENGFFGLNGDLIVWNPLLQQELEISSMGIRVDKKAFLKQAEILNCLELKELSWQKKLMNDEFPLTIGGGIGISRTCMFLLQKAHIGEIQPGVWPEKMIKKCKEGNINLL